MGRGGDKLIFVTFVAAALLREIIMRVSADFIKIARMKVVASFVIASRNAP